MKGPATFTLLFCITVAAQPPRVEPAAESPIPIIEFSWERTRLKVENPEAGPTIPAAAMIPENKNFQRNARDQLSPGAVDPNELTVDGRSAALEKNVQQSRKTRPDPIDGFTYRLKVRNVSDRTVEVIFWEYRFTEIATPNNVVRRQAVCAIKIKPNDVQELSLFSTLGPSNTIDAKTLANASGKLFNEETTVNRLEYSDGAILQNTEWKFAE